MSHRVVPLRRLLSLLVVAAALAGFTVSPGSAHASAGVVYYSAAFAPYETHQGPLVSLNDSYAASLSSASYAVCAGAFTDVGAFYGHYFCANSWACHDYGSDPLHPAAHEHSGVYQNIEGRYWSSPDRYSGCPHGGTVSAPATAASPSTMPAASTFTDGAGSTCLQVADGDGYGITCRSPSEVAAGRLVGTLESPDGLGRVLVAVAPAGASRADLVTGDGASTPVPVDRILETRIATDTQRLRWTTASGEVSVSMATLAPSNG